MKPKTATLYRANYTLLLTQFSLKRRHACSRTLRRRWQSIRRDDTTQTRNPRRSDDENSTKEIIHAIPTSPVIQEERATSIVIRNDEKRWQNHRKRTRNVAKYRKRERRLQYDCTERRLAIECM